MNKFLIVDTSHLFHRARFSLQPGDDEERAGMLLHIMFTSLMKAWRQHSPNHLVFAFDYGSWRKKVYAPYKQNRKQDAADMSLLPLLDVLYEYFSTQTNCTVLRSETLEADDLIAGFVDYHNTSHSIIMSGDADFEQLLSENVSLYNGMNGNTTTKIGVFDEKGRPVIDKNGLPKLPPDPEWSVFEKSIRGCSSDNIFSAYPGVRTKNSKAKVGLEGAYLDRYKRGFDWSSVMLHRWTDPSGIEHLVRDDYERNLGLVDLRMQPLEIKQLIAEELVQACQPKNVLYVGIHFGRFCTKYSLVRLNEMAKEYSNVFALPYPNPIH